LQEEEFDNQQFSQQQFDQQQQGQFANQQSQQGFADSDQQSSNENNLAGLENNEFNQVSDQNIENLGFEEESFAGDGDFLPEQNMENQGFDQISEEDIAELAFENNQSYGNQSAVANGLGPNFDDDLEDGLGGNNQLLNDDELLDNPFSNEVNVVGDNNTGANENNFDPGSDNQNSIASGGSGSGFLRWIGYKYKNKLEVYLRFKGAKIPAYEFLQIKNRKGQPELVVRFPGSKRWH
jgi:hypothetical protein